MNRPVDEQFLAGFGAYDRTRLLLDGRLASPGLPWRFMPMSSPEATRRAFGMGELDAAEVSFGGYIDYLHHGGTAYTALPVFIARAFRHNALYVRANAGVADPRDLSGGRIGLPNYDHTTPIWLRGILREFHGLEWRDVSWVVGPLEDGGPPGTLPPARSSAPTIDRAYGNDGLWTRLGRGDIDAVMTTQRPPGCTGHASSIVRLFADSEAAERKYYGASQCFPILHLIAVRKALAESSPEIVRGLYQAFDKARVAALADLANNSVYAVTLPWLAANLEASLATSGDSIWSYGVADNLAAIQAFSRYALDQGYVDRLLSPAELFSQSFSN